MNDGQLERIPHSLQSDVTLFYLNLDAYSRPDLRSGLGAAELDRAARIVSATDRHRFVAAHHALRNIVAAELQSPAEALDIQTDEFGKPRLQHGGRLEFSLSHSADQCLIGISSGNPVGVDIEIVQTVTDAAALARTHFTLREQAEWSQGAAGNRDGLFLACWTRKEACLKALGVGLSAPPSLIEVGCTREARVGRILLGSRKCEITLHSLPLHGKAVAAVALTTDDDAALARQIFRRRAGSA